MQIAQVHRSAGCQLEAHAADDRSAAEVDGVILPQVDTAGDNAPIDGNGRAKALGQVRTGGGDTAGDLTPQGQFCVGQVYSTHGDPVSVTDHLCACKEMQPSAVVTHGDDGILRIAIQGGIGAAVEVQRTHHPVVIDIHRCAVAALVGSIVVTQNHTVAHHIENAAAAGDGSVV